MVPLEYGRAAMSTRGRIYPHRSAGILHQRFQGYGARVLACNNDALIPLSNAARCTLSISAGVVNTNIAVESFSCRTSSSCATTGLTSYLQHPPVNCMKRDSIFKYMGLQIANIATMQPKAMQTRSTFADSVRDLTVRE